MITRRQQHDTQILSQGGVPHLSSSLVARALAVTGRARPPAAPGVT